MQENCRRSRSSIATGEEAAEARFCGSYPAHIGVCASVVLSILCRWIVPPCPSPSQTTAITHDPATGAANGVNVRDRDTGEQWTIRAKGG